MKHKQSIKMKLFLVALALGLVCLAARVMTARVRGIENAEVAAFVADVTYGAGDASRVSAFVPESGRRDRPAGYTVRCEGVGEVEVHLKSIYSKCRLSDSRVLHLDGSSGQISLTNLYPDTLYVYRVNSANGLLKLGAFRTAGQVRMLDVDGVYNVRDLGGWQTESGTIKYGLIFRGSEMDGEHEIRISEEGIGAMRDAGVGFDLDLRLDEEVDMDGTGEEPIVSSALGEDVGYERIAIEAYLEPWIGAEEAGSSGESTVEAEVKAAGEAGNEVTGEESGGVSGPENVNAVSVTGGIEGSVDADGIDRYYRVFRRIFDCVEQGVPVYIHCWGGADRTGTVCLLLEGLLGVSESDVVKEYELTTFAQKFGTRSKDREAFKRMMEYVEGREGATLTEKFEGIFLEMGFAEEEIRELRGTVLAE